MNLEDFLDNELRKDTLDVVINFSNGDILEDHNYRNYVVIDCSYENKQAVITIERKN